MEAFALKAEKLGHSQQSDATGSFAADAFIGTAVFAKWVTPVFAAPVVQPAMVTAHAEGTELWEVRLAFETIATALWRPAR